MDRTEIINVNGGKLYLVKRGVGAPVVLLGGPWFGQRYLQPLAENLAADFQIVAYDPRGSGNSDERTENEINLAGHLEDLDGLRQALDLDRMNLIGHSLGALVCLAYAIENPQNIGALVLANPGPPMVPEMQEKLHMAFIGAFTGEEQKMLAHIQASPGFEARDPEIHEAYFKSLYGAFFRDKRAASGLEFGFTSATARYALEAEEQLVGQLMALDPMGSLSNVASPTLVIHAEQDLIPKDFSRLLADRIPGAKFVLLEGVGHFAYLEDAPLFRRTIVDFLWPETKIWR